MNKENDFKSWEEVILNFLDQKKSAEENKCLKELLKDIQEIYKDANNQTLNELIESKKEKQQSLLDFQREQLKKINSLIESDDFLSEDTARYENITERYATECKKTTEKYECKNWITSAAKNVSSVVFATHVAKLTHSKIDSPSLIDSVDEQKNDFLTSSSLKNKILDGAISGNQFAPIFQFLELEINGQKMATALLDQNHKIFEALSDSEKEISSWKRQFHHALYVKNIKSHSLLKQTYFPIKIENVEQSYHLLSQLKSSSLAHAIFLKTSNDAQKALEKLRKEKKFSNTISSRFVNKAKLGVTASNHSNASQLNGKRGGKIHLFSAQPPTWKTQINPPISKKSFLQDFYLKDMQNIHVLGTFLLKLKELNLSIKDPVRRQLIENLVSNIIDDFFFYTATMQNLPASWSDNKNIKLKVEHQYLLDPFREDELFQQKRSSVNWQKTILDDFARWFNNLLKKNNKGFTPKEDHTRIWRELLEQPLREDAEAIQAEIKQKLKREKK